MGRREVFSAREFARGIDRASRIVLLAPAPDGIVVLKTEADGIEDLVAIRAGGLVPEPRHRV